jgi:hypothetical protein
MLLFIEKNAKKKCLNIEQNELLTLGILREYAASAKLVYHGKFVGQQKKGCPPGISGLSFG